jgi:hypothetical protein
MSPFGDISNGRRSTTIALVADQRQLRLSSIDDTAILSPSGDKETV